MSIESLSLERMQAESGVEQSDIQKFQALFNSVHKGVDRKTLAEFWALLKDKTDEQMETLVGMYINALPEDEKNRSTLPATYEMVMRIRHALQSVFERPKKRRVESPSGTKKKSVPESHSGRQLAEQVNARIERKARDAKELQMAVDDPAAFWRMMEGG